MCWTRCVLIYDISDVRCPPSFHSMQHPRKTSIDASIGKFLNFHVHHMTSWRVNILIILCQFFTLFLQRCWAIETKHFLFQFFGKWSQILPSDPLKNMKFWTPCSTGPPQVNKEDPRLLASHWQQLASPLPIYLPKVKLNLFYYHCSLLLPSPNIKLTQLSNLACPSPLIPIHHLLDCFMYHISIQ